MSTIPTFLHFQTWPSRPSNFLLKEERESLLWTFPKFCIYCLDSFCHGGSHISHRKRFVTWIMWQSDICTPRIKTSPKAACVFINTMISNVWNTSILCGIASSPKCTFSFLGMLGASGMMTENLYIPRSWIGKSLFAEESGKGSQVQRIRMRRFALALTTHQYNPESTTAATSFSANFRGLVAFVPIWNQSVRINLGRGAPLIRAIPKKK